MSGLTGTREFALAMGRRTFTFASDITFILQALFFTFVIVQAYTLKGRTWLPTFFCVCSLYCQIYFIISFVNFTLFHFIQKKHKKSLDMYILPAAKTRKRKNMVNLSTFVSITPRLL